MSSTPNEPPQEPRRTVSEAHQSWWPGWIWGIPVAAIAIVVWLVLRAIASHGIHVSIVFEEASGLKPSDTKVLYRGLNVGEVRALRLAEDGAHVIAQVDLDRAVEKFLRAGTRFYLQEPTLTDPSSLKAILSASSIQLVPGSGPRARHFVGSLGEPPESFKVRLPYLVVFSQGDAGDLKRGAPVKVRGFTVGEVSDVQLAVDATGAVVTPVVLTLDPTRFHIRGVNPANGDWRGVLNATLAELIEHGFRARLAQAPPLLGTREVVLDIEPHAVAASLRLQSPYPEIPASGGGGLEGFLAQVGTIPVAEIGSNVRAITARLESLVSSPQLHDSIVRLDNTLAELDRTIHAVGPRLPPTIDSAHAAIDSLRKAAQQIDATAAVAQRTISSSGAEQGANIQDALRELTEAARAARSLANELDDRPESLIRGR
jgi:paraquat-inducible protein B